MAEIPFAPDFLFSTITNVHFGGGGYGVILFDAFVDATVTNIKGGQLAEHVALPLSQGGTGLGIGIAVFGNGTFTFQVRGSLDGTQLSAFITGEVFSKSPFDKLGQKFFHDYQGADQVLRLSFGAAPSAPQPNPDNTAGLAPGAGNFIMNVKVNITKPGQGTITLTNASRQGG